MFSPIDSLDEGIVWNGDLLHVLTLIAAVEHRGLYPIGQSHLEGSKEVTILSTLLILQVCDLGGNVLEHLHQILGCRPLNVNSTIVIKQNRLAHCLDCGFKN